MPVVPKYNCKYPDPEVHRSHSDSIPKSCRYFSWKSTYDPTVYCTCPYLDDAPCRSIEECPQKMAFRSIGAKRFIEVSVGSASSKILFYCWLNELLDLKKRTAVPLFTTVFAVVLSFLYVPHRGLFGILIPCSVALSISALIYSIAASIWMNLSFDSRQKVWNFVKYSEEDWWRNYGVHFKLWLVLVILTCWAVLCCRGVIC